MKELVAVRYEAADRSLAVGTPLSMLSELSDDDDDDGSGRER